MDKTNQMHGESREQQNDTQTSPMQNGNTNDLDSRSHNRDNSGMHAGSTEGSSTGWSSWRCKSKCPHAGQDPCSKGNCRTGSEEG